MESLYRNRSKIAKITLASIIFVLLLALNYKIFRVSYSEGSFVETIITSSESIDQSMPEQNLSEVQNLALNKISKYLPDLIAGIAEVSVKSALIFIVICLARVSIYKKDDDTLVSLCVRMDE